MNHPYTAFVTLMHDVGRTYATITVHEDTATMEFTNPTGYRYSWRSDQDNETELSIEVDTTPTNLLLEAVVALDDNGWLVEGLWAKDGASYTAAVFRDSDNRINYSDAFVCKFE